ncbi:MAG: glycosyltransferase [Ignavibacteriales bacterium]|nr:glycosyltransferase [Ignavibacteriales bacterium]
MFTFFAKLNKAKIFYNSREIYAHLAGLRKKKFVQKIIAKIESKFIGKVDFVLVTGEMDKEYLAESYGLNNILVLRNLPKFTEVKKIKIDLREKLNIPNDQKILLYQGVILEGRGIKKVIDVLDKINNAHFVIIGDGEFRKQFESEITGKPIESRVHFIGQVNHKDLLSYTASADLGLALIENISLSYYYALPNKIFEYIMAEVPILCSDLPQMKKIVDDYKVGNYVNLEKDNLANAINRMLNDNELLNEYKANCKQAAKELNWDFEFNKIKDLLLN